MSRNTRNTRSILALIASILGLGLIVSLFVAPSASAGTVGSVSGNFTSVDPWTATDPSVHATLQVADDTTVVFEYRWTDSSGGSGTFRTLVDGPSDPVVMSYPFSLLTGPGPWTVDLRFTIDGEQYFDLDTGNVPLSTPVVTPALSATSTANCQVTVTYADIEPPFEFSVKGKKTVNVVSETVVEAGVAVYELSLTGAPTKGGKANTYDVTVAGGSLTDKVSVVCPAA